MSSLSQGIAANVCKSETKSPIYPYSEPKVGIKPGKKTLNLIKKESKFLMDSISKIKGFTCYNSDTNFILIKSNIKSKEIQRLLLKKNILIRNCNTIRGLDENFIRISVRTHKENLRLIKALREI